MEEKFRNAFKNLMIVVIENEDVEMAAKLLDLDDGLYANDEGAFEDDDYEFLFYLAVKSGNLDMVKLFRTGIDDVSEALVGMFEYDNTLKDTLDTKILKYLSRQSMS